MLSEHQSRKPLRIGQRVRIVAVPAETPLACLNGREAVVTSVEKPCPCSCGEPGHAIEIEGLRLPLGIRIHLGKQHLEPIDELPADPAAAWQQLKRDLGYTQRSPEAA